MRRKADTLTPLEIRILQTGLQMAAEGSGDFYGFLLAKRMKEEYGAHFRTAYGPLYKALDRMAGHGLLEGRWEDPEEAAAERRPRRCFYRVTGTGERALEAATRTTPPAIEGEAQA